MTRRSLIEAVAVSVCLAVASQAVAEPKDDTGARQEATSPGERVDGGARAGGVDASTTQFVISAAGGGIAEVEMGRLALKKASDANVKQHAQKMIDDHTKANAELERIATAKGIEVPKKPDAKHQQMLDRLSALDGKEFEKAYIQQGGVQAHTEMQQLFRTEAQNGKDPEVKAFAQKTLPVVEEHLKHSETMAGGKHDGHGKDDGHGHGKDDGHGH